MMITSDVVNKISKLKTFSIPIIDDGMPYVRLDEVADILSYIPDLDVSSIYARVREEHRKYSLGNKEDIH